jgi:hypothetical protein
MTLSPISYTAYCSIECPIYYALPTPNPADLCLQALPPGAGAPPTSCMVLLLLQPLEVYAAPSCWPHLGLRDGGQQGCVINCCRERVAVTQERTTSDLDSCCGEGTGCQAQHMACLPLHCVQHRCKRQQPLCCCQPDKTKRSLRLLPARVVSGSSCRWFRDVHCPNTLK